MSRQNKYGASTDQDTLEELSKKLANDLRGHVRNLEKSALFSREWIHLTESLQHIATIAKMEHRLPAENAASTLWEEDEVVVRFILEEGKLNMCLRYMNDFITELVDINSRGREQWLARTARSLELEPVELESRLAGFEASLGQLLRCCFLHIEAVQTTDIPQLFEHVRFVLLMTQDGRLPTMPSWEQSQPSLVLRYLAAVLERIEPIGENKMMPDIERRQLIPLVIHHLHDFHQSIPPEDMAGGCRFLALAFDTEEFETNRNLYLPANDGVLMDKCRQMRPLFLNGMTGTHEQKKKYRPLLDVLQRIG